MLKFLEDKLSFFKSCFSRIATFRYVVITSSLMTYTEFLGALLSPAPHFIHSGKYESLFVQILSPLFPGRKPVTDLSCGRDAFFVQWQGFVLMEYILGHLYGGVGTIISPGSSLFCLPLDMNIQNRLANIASWDENGRDTTSHCCHFWIKTMPKLNKHKKGNLLNCHRLMRDKTATYLKDLYTIERFVLCACIAMGHTQMISLPLSILKPYGITVT